MLLLPSLHSLLDHRGVPRSAAPAKRCRGAVGSVSRGSQTDQVARLRERARAGQRPGLACQHLEVVVEHEDLGPLVRAAPWRASTRPPRRAVTVPPPRRTSTVRPAYASGIE